MAQIPIFQPLSTSGGDNNEPPAGQCDISRQYALALGKRVRSFETDSLHSTAYLTYLAKYLKAPFQKQPRRYHAPFTQLNLPRRPFVHRYKLQVSKQPDYSSFDDLDAYNLEPKSGANEVIFLTGRPSAQWLNAVGSKYQVDYRFFHQHLGSLLTSQKHWYTTPGLPCRSMEVLRLCIPSIVFIGSQGRDVDVLGLEMARHDCTDRLRRSLKSIQDSTALDAGSSIIRRMQIHSGSALVIEQEITITLVKKGENWTLLIWTDAGNEADPEYIPVPHTTGFETVSSAVEFCPVFFESHFSESQDEQVDNPPKTKLTKQPLSLLSKNYGITIDWASCADQSPLFVLQELLAFEAAAALQYINMIEHVLSDHMRGTRFPSYEHTKLETILHFDYAKAELTRSQLHFAEVLAFLEDPPHSWKSNRVVSDPAVAATHDVPRAIELLKGDFRYLVSRVERLLSICDADKTTLINNATVQEAKRSAKESRLVTELTKATNRVTFIFLPISYITSIFGLNFSQFGQGSLSIWLWAVISLPLFIASVIVVEYGSLIKDRFRRKRL